MTQWQEGESHRSQNRDSCPSTNCTQTDRGGGQGDSYELWGVTGPPGGWAWFFFWTPQRSQSFCCCNRRFDSVKTEVEKEESVTRVYCKFSEGNLLQRKNPVTFVTFGTLSNRIGCTWENQLCKKLSTSSCPTEGSLICKIGNALMF